MPTRDTIVIGASSGGIEALKLLTSGFREDLDAAILVVQHIAAHSPSYLPQILERSGGLRCKPAEDGESIEKGTIYVAPPGRHLLVRDQEIQIDHGPRENRARPAVDPLFRTAAVSLGPRVIGVILTGSLDDGAAGLAAVKNGGGLAVVQDPAEAAYPEMPRSALRYVEADHVEPLLGIAPLLNQLVGEKVSNNGNRVAADMDEADIETGRSNIERVSEIGQLAPLSCPECGGPLWEIDGDEVPRFRCHTGHAFSSLSLLAEQSDATERALWAALRTMDERTRMLERLSGEHAQRGHERSSQQFATSAKESMLHAEALRRLLVNVD